MSTSKTKKTIDAGYFRLCRLTESSGDMSRLLEQCHAAALDGERKHRRFTGRPSAVESCETAARYFCCKWVLDETRPPKTWLEAATMRPDTLAGLALGELIRARPPNGIHSNWVPEVGAAAGLDYSKDIIGRDS